MRQFVVRHRALVTFMTGVVVSIGAWTFAAQRGEARGRLSDFLRFSAPAGDRPATTDTVIDGVRAAILPNGRFVTPAGTRGERPGAEAVRHGVVAKRRDAGDAQQRRRTVLADVDCATQQRRTPSVKRIDVNASFMGVTFSPDSRRVYLSGGENGNIWIGDAVAGQIIGSVNLNGADASARSAARRGGQRRSCVSRALSRATWPSAATVAISTSSIRAAFRFT